MIPSPRRVVVFSNDQTLLRQWQAALAAKAIDAVVLFDSGQLRLPGDGDDRSTCQLDANNPGHWRRHCQQFCPLSL